MKLCPLLNSALEIDPHGRYRPCCHFGMYLKDNNDNFYTSSKNMPTEVFNSDMLSTARAQSKTGRVDGCELCYNEEDLGIISRRKRELESKSYYTDSVQLREVDIKLGSKCNLKCVTCWPVSSDKVAQEQLQLNWIDSLPLTDNDYYTNNEFWDDIASHSTLTQLDFMGGEPFLIQEHYRLLDKLVKNELSKNIKINYVTNGTIFNENRIQSVVSNFREVVFAISGDGTFDTFEYNRYPAKWDTWINNVNQFKKFGVCVIITYTISIFSIFNLIDSLKFFKDNNIKIWINFVHRPEEWNLHCLPMEIKLKLENMLQNVDPELLSVLHGTQLPELINFIMSSDTSENFSKTVRLIQERDCFRGTDFTNILPPDIKEIWNRYK